MADIILREKLMALPHLLLIVWGFELYVVVM